MPFSLQISVQIENMTDWERANDQATTVVGRRPDGAGTGFGLRDMDWEFDTQTEAQEALARVAQVSNLYSASISEYNDEE